MEIKYKNLLILIKTIFICLLIISCKDNKIKQDEKNKKNKILNEKLISFKNDSVINFFETKYKTKFEISFGDEDISEYPYCTYYNYDDKNVQWFSIAYVPKKMDLQDFWKNYLQGKSNLKELENSQFIAKRIKNNLENYNVFAVKLEKKYFDANEKGIGEDIFLKKTNQVLIYYFNQVNNEWTFKLKINKTDYLMGQNIFFIKLFPDLFQ